MRAPRALTVSVCGLVAILLATPAFATAIAVTNASFEADSPLPGFFLAAGPSGWVQTGAGGPAYPIIPTEVASVPDGNNVEYMDGSSQNTDVEQDLGVPVIVGANYTLHVYVASLLNLTNGDSYSIELLTNNTPFAIRSATIGAQTPFQLVTASGIGAGSGDVQVELLTTSGNSMLFDAVSVDVEPARNRVPEPATLALTAFGVAGAVTRRRRRSPSCRRQDLRRLPPRQQTCSPQ